MRITRRTSIRLMGLSVGLPLPAASTAVPIRLRSRVELFKGSNVWNEVTLTDSFKPTQSAVLICDMWDNHWCSGATKRVGTLAKSMAQVLEKARKAKIQVIHAPSDVMDFYEDYPQRQFMKQFAANRVEPGLMLTDPPLPIDDKQGGCDTGENTYKAWKRQHSGIPMEAGDVISDKGAEIQGLLRLRGIDTLFVMGVHTNMCILNRTFAIKQMTKWGFRCILVRDLTDAMYDPKASPFVSHEQGTELVVQHIEKYWCPTTLSADFTKALATSHP